jgi:paraquat-inducible protein A
MSPVAVSSFELRRLVACTTCDLLHERVPLPAGGVARCARCGSALYDERALWLEHALAFTLAAAVLLALSAAFTLMAVEVGGVSAHSGLETGPIELWRQGHAPLALLVLFATLLAPGLRLGLLLYVLVSLRRGRRRPGLVGSLRLVDGLRDWGMPEVFVLGAIVAWIKLADIATVSLGPAMAAFGALVLALSAANAALDPRDAWDALERLA